MGESGFVRGASAIAQCLMRGGSTAAIPPISHTLKLGQLWDGTARQPLICGADNPTAGGEGNTAGRYGGGIFKEYSFF